MAVSIGAVPAVFPVNYGVLDGAIVFRTGEGSKLDAAVRNAVVAFEIDEVDPLYHEGWSVLVVGLADEVRDGPLAARAQHLPLKPWAPGPRHHLVAIHPEIRLGPPHRPRGRPTSTATVAPRRSILARMARSSVLTARHEDFPQWYQDVLAKAELAENGPVRGTIVIRPYGYAIWERMQAEIDARIKAAGVANAYFPLLIPESYLRKEAQHVEGFSPELAVVTVAGGKELEEPLVVRPTSETIINASIAKWVQSYRDLPLLLNQWANVVRWELRPRLFLRTTEFLWQEGHTAHATEGEARDFALQILRDVYEDFMVHVLAVPILTGRKTEGERFSGATNTWTCEAMMGDGKALQMGTSHELGQNFAKVFDITFLDERGEQVFAWQTSWGVSTRLMGALVMAHGDDAGLRLPPRIAPVQVVVVVVRDEQGAGDRAAVLAAELEGAGLRVELDGRTDTSFGRRVVNWELKGVPVRVEVGPPELAGGEVVLVRRDTGTKTTIPLDQAPARVREALDAAQRALYDEALDRQRRADGRGRHRGRGPRRARLGFAVVPSAALGPDGEERLNRAGVSIRCLQGLDGALPPSSEEPGTSPPLLAVVGRAY